MIILIAESKTMSIPHDIPSELYTAHMPLYEEKADMIMTSLRKITQPQLAQAIGISANMARYSAECIYNFADKLSGIQALEAFTGVVFKALDPASLPADARKRACRSLRIISSLYGWLRPDDVIKPYRFDFNTKLAPNGESFMKYWKKDVTIALVKMIKESADREVLNLLPADASKCIDWKLVKNFAKVYVAEFKRQDGDALRTPHAGRLKELRGTLLRDILMNDVASAEELCGLSGDEYIAQGEMKYPGHFVYLTD